MNKSTLIHKIESYIPNGLLGVYRKCKRYVNWQMQQCVYHRVVRLLRKKQGPLNVIFINTQLSVWKYSSLFELMMRDERFNPMVLVCPLEGRGQDLKLKSYEESCAYFNAKGYPMRCAYDAVNETYLNIKKLAPDIVFYSTQYPNQINKRYNQYKLRQYLKCFVNYAFVNVSGDWSSASAVHGLMWRYFSECESNRQLALSYNKHEFQNMRVVGYPIYDEYQKASGEPSDWKNPDPNFKRIIWAPHHTIEGQTGLLQFSTFLLHCDVMLEMADKYKNKVQFVFKPHPLLRNNLYEHKDWGKERTDAYYAKWEKGENTAFVNGNYMNLFKSSDAIIHDSGSFLVEYLYTKNSGMYLSNYDRSVQSNEVGKRAYKCYYHGYTAKDIDDFIGFVIKGYSEEILSSRREQFYNEVLLPPNGKTVAENIIDEIIKGIYG